jgi:hypothetical protein
MRQYSLTSDPSSKNSNIAIAKVEEGRELDEIISIVEGIDEGLMLRCVCILSVQQSLTSRSSSDLEPEILLLDDRATC